MFPFFILFNKGPLLRPSWSDLFTRVTSNCDVYSADGVCIVGILKSNATVTSALYVRGTLSTNILN